MIEYIDWIGNISETVVWIIFAVIIFIVLALDMGVFRRQSHDVKVKEAITWTAVWVIVALLFNVGLYFWMFEKEITTQLLAQNLKVPTPEIIAQATEFAEKKSFEYLTGYLLEKTLSLDNVFVFYLIFSYFGIEKWFQHRVLFWGILGALVLRGLFIGAGTTLVTNFHWLLNIFGVLLIYAAIKTIVQRDDEEIDPEKSFILRTFNKFFPVSKKFYGQRFFVREDGHLKMTPLFIVLIMIETSDIMFAIDSVPAIFAITQDPLIIYTSNIFAILGLRALYFVLASIVNMFRFLNYGIGLVLAFTGVKIILSNWIEIPLLLSLIIIIGTITTTIVLSFVFKEE